MGKDDKKGFRPPNVPEFVKDDDNQDPTPKDPSKPSKNPTHRLYDALQNTRDRSAASMQHSQNQEHSPPPIEDLGLDQADEDSKKWVKTIAVVVGLILGAWLLFSLSDEPADEPQVTEPASRTTAPPQQKSRAQKTTQPKPPTQAKKPRPPRQKGFSPSNVGVPEASIPPAPKATYVPPSNNAAAEAARRREQERERERRLEREERERERRLEEAEKERELKALEAQYNQEDEPEEPQPDPDEGASIPPPPVDDEEESE